jgi:hypothetical protein
VVPMPEGPGRKRSEGRGARAGRRALPRRGSRWRRSSTCRLEEANGELSRRYLDLRSHAWIPIGINMLLLLEACWHGYMLFAVTTRRLITS